MYHVPAWHPRHVVHPGAVQESSSLDFPPTVSGPGLQHGVLLVIRHLVASSVQEILSSQDSSWARETTHPMVET